MAAPPIGRAASFYVFAATATPATRALGAVRSPCISIDEPCLVTHEHPLLADDLSLVPRTPTPGEYVHNVSRTHLKCN